MAQTSRRVEPNAEPILTETSLQLRRRLPAPRDEVFRVWTQPEHIRRWSCPSGFSVVESQVDLRQGGSYRLGMKSPAGEVFTTIGVYREVQPPVRLVYTWRWDSPDSVETLVTVEFRDLGKETELLLRHERFSGAGPRDSHLGGWVGCLDSLDLYMASHAK
jgi:uncharacterized protein YndB with AHSA1/START domain